MSQAFHFNSIADKLPLVKERVQEVIDEIKEKNMDDGQYVFKAVDQMKEITGEVSLRAFFGSKIKNQKTNNNVSLNYEIS